MKGSGRAIAAIGLSFGSLKDGVAYIANMLRPHERAVYEMIADPHHEGHRRIEQERIPLAVAWDHVARLITGARLHVHDER